FYYADSGLLTILMILEQIMLSLLDLSQFLSFMKDRYPISGELNTKVADADAVLLAIEQAYARERLEKIDGLSIECDEWRANIRKSNTEPLVRLNVEAKSKELVEAKVKELMQFIK
ncbi:phosphomannomutase/phosphoglucomutase, partial [Candidatus Falkowbacteria bacterium]|nr:phosphomannomutase/phosphoglucomutase [Candidatus Falkowbacteria bacterium]